MVRSLALGAAGSVMIASGAMAADVPPLVVAAPPPPPMAAPTFDWGGAYVRVFGGTILPVPSPFGALIEGGAGYNFVAGQFVAGVQGQCHVGVGDWAPGFIGCAAEGHAGVLIGDKLLAYAVIGINGDSFGYRGWYYGGGLELALGNSWSVFADLLQGKELGCMGCDFRSPYFRIGVAWHPGN